MNSWAAKVKNVYSWHIELLRNDRIKVYFYWALVIISTCWPESIIDIKWSLAIREWRGGKVVI
jgi:hypothetical protein